MVYVESQLVADEKELSLIVITEIHTWKRRHVLIEDLLIQSSVCFKLNQVQELFHDPVLQPNLMSQANLLIIWLDNKTQPSYKMFSIFIFN